MEIVEWYIYSSLKSRQLDFMTDILCDLEKMLCTALINLGSGDTRTEKQNKKNKILNWIQKVERFTMGFCTEFISDSKWANRLRFAMKIWHTNKQTNEKKLCTFHFETVIKMMKLSKFIWNYFNRFQFCFFFFVVFLSFQTQFIFTAITLHR